MTRGKKNPLHLGLAARLRQTREARDLSRRALCRAAGVASSAIWSLEDGRVPGLETLERVAVALGVSPCWLAYGDEGPLPFLEKRPRSEAPAPYPLLETPAFEAADAAPAPLACAGAGARLRLAREARGLSRKELGRASETSDTTVRLTEEGQVIPGLGTTEQLARALAVSPGWLAFGEGQGPGPQ